MTFDESPVTSADDPRLRGMGQEHVAGADQIAGLLEATPDGRLDHLIAVLRFVEEARAALHEVQAHATPPAA